MSTTEISEAGQHEGGGHHESPRERHKKEHMALWLFIGGDAVFFALEIFFWFYLRTLNVNGMWLGNACSKLNPCTDGLGNPITAPISEASGLYTMGVAALIIVSAVFIWQAEIQARSGAHRKATTPLLGLAVVFCLAAIGLQIYQFQVLPCTTIDGAYASTYEFFMGSTLAHLLIMAFVGTGLWIRAGKGRYQGTWFRVRLIRFFAVWIAVSTTVLVVVAALFY